MSEENVTPIDAVKNESGAVETLESLLPIDEHVEEVRVDGKQVRHKGVYLLPNLFTTGALFAGFYAILAAIHGDFYDAAIAICVAGVLDGCDGAVARLTNTQSAFGAQYDSMSDLVAFGVAPAVLSYLWLVSDLGKLGWMAVFVYVACAAMRLARFNVQIESTDKRFFTGLPSPAAAGFIATMVWLGVRGELEGSFLSVCVAIAVATTGILMVSNIPFPSFKEWNIGRVPFAALIGVVMLFGVVFIDPPLSLFSVALIYIAGSVGYYIWHRVMKAVAGK